MKFDNNEGNKLHFTKIFLQFSNRDKCASICGKLYHCQCGWIDGVVNKVFIWVNNKWFWNWKCSVWWMPYQIVIRISFPHNCSAQGDYNNIKNRDYNKL